MIKTFAAALLFASAPALAQTTAPVPQPSPTPPAAPQAMTPPPEFIAAAQAFGQCVGTKAQTQPATATPEAAAHVAFVGCTAERTALDTRFEAWVASTGFPEAGRARAREQYKAQMAAAEGQIAAKICEGRAGTTAPVPSATPAAPRR